MTTMKIEHQKTNANAKAKTMYQEKIKRGDKVSYTFLMSKPQNEALSDWCLELGLPMAVVISDCIDLILSGQIETICPRWLEAKNSNINTHPWKTFHKKIGLESTDERSSKLAQIAVEAAAAQGLGEWRYDSRSRRFHRI
jgi:hypothetical protein